jgi:thioredoxin-like negative regulator of GroEL
VQLDPLNPAELFALGQALRREGDSPAAAEAMAQSFALDPTPESFFELMHALIETGRFDEARRLFESEAAMLARAEIQDAPMTRDWFRHLIGDLPPPDPDDLLARMDRGEGFHEIADLLLAKLGALRHGGMMLDRMGA